MSAIDRSAAAKGICGSLFAVLVSLLCSAATGAQVRAVRQAVELDADTTGGGRPAVGVREDGSFLVVWSADADGDGLAEVLGSLREPNGRPLAGPERVSEPAAGSQMAADVAAGPGGDFVVAWTDIDGYTESQYGYRVNQAVAREVDGSGRPTGPRFVVAHEVCGFSSYGGVGSVSCTSLSAPQVEGADSGRYLVSWSAEFYGQSWPCFREQCANRRSVVVRTGPDREVTGGPASFDEPAYGDTSAAASSRDGGFVVAWSDFGYGFGLAASIVGREGVATLVDPSSYDRFVLAGANEGFVVTYDEYGLAPTGDRFMSRRVSRDGDTQVPVVLGGMSTLPLAIRGFEASLLALVERDRRDGLWDLLGELYDDSGQRIGEVTINQPDQALSAADVDSARLMAVGDNGFAVLWSTPDAEGTAARHFLRHFVVGDCSLRVVEPSVGARWRRDGSATIRWAADGSGCASGVTISIVRNGSVLRRYQGDNAVGQLTLTVPRGWPVGPGYAVRVNDLSDPTVVTVSRRFRVAYREP